MFKTLMIGLVAVGLVAIFIAEAANAATIRRRNTVENIHICNEFLPDGVTPDLCFGAKKVTDTLYGWDEALKKAICTMTGTVVCDREENAGICTVEESALLEIDSFTSGATFVTETKTAIDLTVLPRVVGQGICDSIFEVEGTIFSRFWPNVAVAHTIYTDIVTDFPNIVGTEKTYELIELCFAQTGSDLYLCETLWDSVYGSDEILGIEGEPMPKFPCCGEVNTLTVDVGAGGGTVTSDDGKINCGTDCCEEYDGTVAPYDGCPEVKLTATPNYGYEFTEWGGDCSGIGECIVTPEAEVTATFELGDNVLRVLVEGNVDGARVWIKDPRGNFDDPSVKYCYDECIAIFEEGDTVVLKRKGGTYISWDGVDCVGSNNSNDTCEISMDGSAKEATAIFAP